MKIIVVLALIAAALATDESCAFFNSQDGAYNYRIPTGWFNGTDQEGYTWYFRTCPGLAEINPCEGAIGSTTENIATVCQEIKGITYAKGVDSSRVISDSPYGNNNGVEIMYGLESGSVKTVIELVCSTTEDNIVVKVVDESTTIITFNSKENCPEQPEIFDGPGFYASPMVEEEEGTIIIPGAFIYFLFLCTSLLCVCCCCTCLIRRKKQQQRKDIQMKQFSSVAFQPIPAANKAPSAPQPTYNPYVPQPQFVYYYPSQNGSVAEFPLYTQTNNVENVQDDEAMARNLQAQFDREQV